MDELKQHYPAINAEITVSGSLFLKLSEAAAQEHMRVDQFAARLLAEALANHRIFQTTWPRPRETR
jgi:hypothetical protein